MKNRDEISTPIAKSTANQCRPMSNRLLKCTGKLNRNKTYPTGTQLWTWWVSGPMPASPTTPGSLPLAILPLGSPSYFLFPHLSVLSPGFSEGAPAAGQAGGGRNGGTSTPPVESHDGGNGAGSGGAGGHEAA
jgi:hypothetical protein